MKYKVGAVQISMHQLDLEYNLKTLEKYVRMAAADGAKLLLLPETCNIGSLCTTREGVLPYAEPIPGKSTRFFSKLCVELDVAIAFGMVEHDLSNDLIYNSVAFIGRDGNVIGTYRKTHLFSTETNFLVPGNTGFPVFDTEFGRIGINICEDTVHFEAARLVALQGIDVLLMSTCWVDNGPDDSWRTRAAENGVYMICADWWNTNAEGVKYGGGSCIIDPEGNVIDELAFDDGYIVSEIDTELVRRDDIMKGRKKSKYQWLMQDSYLWGSNGQNLPEPAVSENIILAYRTESIEEYLKTTSEKLGKHLKEDTKLVVLPAFYESDVPDNFIGKLQNVIPEGSDDVMVVISYKKEGAKVTCLFKKAEVLLTYHNIHQFVGEEVRESLDTFNTIDTPIGRIGLLGDADLFFPEALRCLVRKGADVVCVSGFWKRKQIFILNERRLFSDCALFASCQDDDGEYAYFGAPYALKEEEANGVLQAQLDTGNEFIRNKIDIRKARIDLFEGLLAY